MIYGKAIYWGKVVSGKDIQRYVWICRDALKYVEICKDMQMLRYVEISGGMK